MRNETIKYRYENCEEEFPGPSLWKKKRKTAKGLPDIEANVDVEQ